MSPSRTQADDRKVDEMEGQHVVVLGAGFSRAISAAMPLTDELGRQAVELLAANGRRLSATQLGFGPELTFESWLSLLSEDQPQLTDAENRDNAALFAHLRDAIGDRLLDAQREALLQLPPGWLYELVGVLHRWRATVITLNYDVLVEAAVQTHEIWDPAVRRRVQPGDLLRNLPPLPNVGARLVGPLCRTFTLLKLHGSLDWWAVPNDASGATLTREDRRPVFGDPDEMPIEQRQRELPGRERFIIPPLSTKSTYYRNPLTRELWQQAHRALSAATRISLVGYSMPPADLVMTNMLRPALSTPGIEVDVVNPDPDRLVDRLIGLGLRADAIETIADNDCVGSFSTSLCSQASAALANELRRSLLDDSPDAALAVAWGDPTALGGAARRVAEVLVHNSTLELVLERDSPQGDVTAARLATDASASREVFPSAADVADNIGQCDRVIARDADHKHTLIAAWHEGRNVGANARWLFFAPADAP